MPQSPNVVLFITHDTGRFISPCGVSTVHTPASERLASEGVSFTRAHCTAPLCCPARASCVTGTYPHQHGVMGLTAEHLGGFHLNDPTQHAAHLFKAGGYDTVLCGFEHEAVEWQPLGFDKAISGPAGFFNGGGDLRNHASEIHNWLEAREGAQPFYMQIGCHETHLQWDQFDVEPDDELGVTVPPYLEDTPAVRKEVAAFQGAVRRLDEGLGQILDMFDQHGLTDDTIFIFTTDHGADFPRAKGTLNDGGTGVFLLMRYPAGGWVPGRRVEQLVSHIDLLPTVLESCGLEVPSYVAGRSLVGLLRGGDEPVHDAVFTQKTYHDFYDPSRAVRTQRFAYLRHFEVNLFQDLRSGTLDRRAHFKTDSWRRSVEELYDLAADPDELVNVADDPGYAEDLADMRRRLAEWMQSTGDPLLDGPVQSPAYRRLAEQLKACAGGMAPG